MQKKILAGLTAGLFFVVGMLGVASANLITNGNFEEGGGSLTGWTTSGTVTLESAIPFATLQGMDDHYAFLGIWDPVGTQMLSQSFSVAGIDELSISFDWAFDFSDFNAAADDSFLALAKQDNSDILKITMLDLKSSAPLGANWGHFTATYSIANWADDTGLVSFVLHEAGGDTLAAATYSIAGIDNVVIAPVPEPATMLLLGTGLAGLAGIRRKRQA